MSRFSDFFEENVEKVGALFAYAPSERFKETVKDCKAVKDFTYEERGINVSAGEFVSIAMKYIDKYVEAKAVELNPKAESYTKKIDWQFQVTTPKKAKFIRRSCEKKEEVKKGYYQKFTDYDEYMEKMVLECTVYPDLQDSELQDSYGVRSEVALLNKLIPVDGELSSIKEFVNKINGFSADIEDKGEEAKN